MNRIDYIWERICENEGNVFWQMRGKPFTYHVVGNTIRLSATNYNISRTALEKALEFVPLENTKPLQHLPAPSYIYALLTDCRIIGENVKFPKCVGEKKPAEIKKRAEQMPMQQSDKTLVVCGYTFRFLQSIVPVCCNSGQIRKYYPQEDCYNKDNLPLLKYGRGAFCRFSITAGNWRGVYLWVSEGKIIYIGETENLRERFNMGYGNISPRNCYRGGQSTNCKMNQIILELYEKGQKVELYFLETLNNKAVELELLKNIKTLYNVKDNG